MPKASNAVRTLLPARALDDLNWMRGLAAVAVLAGHVRGVFFVDYGAVQRSPTLATIYLLTGLGHQAVVVFFVLSGFFIGSSVAAATQDGTWSWFRFAVRRMTRLYVVILPALLMTALWDTAGLSIWRSSGIYGGNVAAPSLTLPIVAKTLTLPILAGNVAFLQELVVPAFGSNGPLWSLSYEAWAYVTFPLLFRAVLGSGRVWKRACLAALGATILLVAGGLFRFYFCVWCVGALVAISWSLLPIRRVGRPLAVAVGGAFLLTLVVARFRVLGARWAEDGALAVATGLLVAARLSRHGSEHTAAPVQSRYARWGDVLAGFSFTLYATHYPVVTFFQAWLVGPERWQPSLTHAVLATVFGLAVIVLYSYPFSRLTEARTDRVRRWVERLATRSSSTVGAR